MTFGPGKPLLGDGAFTNASTFSSLAICCKDFFVPLNRIDDVREMTFSVLICQVCRQCIPSCPRQSIPGPGRWKDFQAAAPRGIESIVAQSGTRPSFGPEPLASSDR